LKRVAPTGPRLALAAALSAATVALALASLGPGAALGVAAVIVAFLAAVPFFEWTQVPARLARSLPRFVALVLLVTALFAWLSRSVGTLVLDPALFPRVAGPVSRLPPSFSPRAADFAVGRTLAPTIIGLVGVAGLVPSPEGYRGTALRFLRGSEHTAFAAHYLVLAVLVALSLWASAILESGPRWSRRALATLAVSPGQPWACGHRRDRVPCRSRTSNAPSPPRCRGHDWPRGNHARGVRPLCRAVVCSTCDVVAGRRRMAAAVEVFTRFDGRRWSNPRPRLRAGSEMGRRAEARWLQDGPGPRGSAPVRGRLFQPKQWSFGSRRPRSGLPLVPRGLRR
jgi:hypothetical protein